MLKTIKILLCALAIFVLVPTLANASPWGPWQTLPNANGVSVSFRQVNESLCTWMIRNNGTTTLRHLEFSYTYTPAVQARAVHGAATGYDLLLSPLKRGQLTGGSTEFGAETGRCPTTLVVKGIEWAH